MKLPQDANVGALAAICIFLFIYGMNFLKGTSLFSRSVYYYAKYTDVSGLLPGSKVMFSGMPVGQIRKTWYDTNQKKVIVEFDVQRDIQIPKDSHAIIYGADILGTKALLLSLGQNKEMAQNGDYLTDSVQIGMVDRAMEQVQPIKVKLESALDEVNLLAKSVRNVIEDSVHYRIQTMLTNFQTISHNLAVTSKGLPALVSTFDSVAGNAQVLTQALANNKDNLNKIFKNVANLSDSLVNTSGDLKTLMSNAQQMLAQLKGLVSDINEGKGTAGKIIKGDELHSQIIKVTESLDALLVEFKEHPKRFVHFSVFGKKDKVQNPLPKSEKKEKKK